jgi:hypothetical protein
MTEQKFYKIWQLYTTGWEVIDRKLTKEECDLRLREYVDSGENPNSLKATPDIEK